ncbi:hypothetical protein FB467_1804 [Ornithinicoccus hortensis]|uniref:Uncharacterized protein n=2 Tax=Ornithinicoccus hortensis TaxID=82346 RepID=A0A542YRI9_9MICO|nr:hypothetical protein FB467_1804 [Ornithinicoccus hortensis]
MLTFAFMGALVMLAVVAYFVAPDVVLPPVWVSLALLGVLVVAIGLSELLLRRATPLPPNATGGQTFQAVQALHLPRMAVLEAPALIGLVTMFALPDQSFVTYLVPAVPTLIAMGLLVVPHRATLERYAKVLDGTGAHSGLADWLTGSTR